MKKNVLVLISLFVLSLTAIGQDKINLVIFSEDGDAFFAFVNGIRQNDKPETNVRVLGVSPNISLRIEFQDKALPSLKQAAPLEPGFEHTLRIVRDMKKQMKLRYFGQTPIGDGTAGGATSIQYHSTENPASDGSSTTISSTPNTINTTVTSTTTTTKMSNGTPEGENVAVNINMPGVGISMNMSGMDMGTTMNTTSTTTVTNSSSSSSSYSSSDNTSQSSSNNIAASKAGCSNAMSAASFAKMKQSVADKPFSDTKMSTAKVATKNACLSVNQVKEICKLFNMDDEKLAYAKYAYDYCVDKANYYQVSEVFSFSGTTDEFNKFLEQ